MRLNGPCGLIECYSQFIALLHALCLAEVSGVKSRATCLTVFVDVEDIVAQLGRRGRCAKPGDYLILRGLAIDNLGNELRI